MRNNGEFGGDGENRVIRQLEKLSSRVRKNAMMGSLGEARTRGDGHKDNIIHVIHVHAYAYAHQRIIDPQ